MGAAHVGGHYGMMNATGQTEPERQMLELMRTHKSDLGGVLRTAFDLLAGFSLTFVVLPLVIGVTGLMVARHGAANRTLMRSVAIVAAGGMGVMLAIALTYWFPAVQVFLGTAFVCFVIALATDR